MVVRHDELVAVAQAVEEVAEPRGGAVLEKITSALAPTARRTELANELRVNVGVLRHLSDLLFDEEATDSAKVCRSVEGFLARKLARAPKRGKGARKRRFLERCLATAKRHRRGLYVCYDLADVPHTSNYIEGLNGRAKHHLRRVAGRASTAGGPFESYGELLLPVVVEAKERGVEALRERAATVESERYAQARQRLKAISEPARRLRSAARRPAQTLAAIIERARVGPRA